MLHLLEPYSGDDRAQNRGAITFRDRRIRANRHPSRDLLIENLGEVQVPDIIAARAQMGMSLAFHIVFACVGVAMPLLMVIAEWLHLKTGDDVYYTLAR